MSIKLISLALETDLPVTERMVLVVLADRANDVGRECWPSATTIAARAGTTERSVWRAICSLEKLGHITRHQRLGYSTQYHVHPILPSRDTPDMVSPLTQCHTPTPDTMSPPPCHGVIPPLTPCHPPPDTVSPDTSFIRPLSVHDTPIEGDENAEPEKSDRTKKRKEPSRNPVKDADLPDWLSRDDWHRWIKYRRELKRQITESGVAGQIADLTKFYNQGQNPADVIDQSIKQGWTGLFKIKEDRRERSSQDPDEPTNPTVRAALKRQAERAAGLR